MRNICITFIQCWSNVEDVGPMLYKCYANGLCLLGTDRSRCSRFSVPPFQNRPTGGEGGMLELVSAHRGYVETSFNIPTGTLKLEKDRFQVTPPPP